MKRLILQCLAFGLSLLGASAAPIVLYHTGWEASPASPGWAIGDIVPQNEWSYFTGNDFDAGTDGHVVVANGSADAIIGATTVVTPYGSRFHRFNGDASTSELFDRFAWPDISAAFEERPMGYNLVTASIDIYIPSAQSADDSFYGLLGFQGQDAIFGALVDPGIRGVGILLGNSTIVITNDVILFDTWTNLSISADFSTGEMWCSVGGVRMTTLDLVNPGLTNAVLNDVDLFVENFVSAPFPRSGFSDNYRVTVDESLPPPTPRPHINIGSNGPGFWALAWDAAFSNWVLESSATIDAVVWRVENFTPTVAAGVASVTVPTELPNRFYRLRQP